MTNHNEDKADMAKWSETETVSETIWDAREKRLELLEGALDWVIRVASDPGGNPDMALRRIAEEARKAMSARQ